MILLIIFVIIPLIEIGLFLSVGAEIGILNTLFLCFLTAIIGAFMLREQGLKTLFSAREAMARNELPVAALFDGICLSVAGICLMTPGFFTDGIGFSLLVPGLRKALRHYLAKHFKMQMGAPPDFKAESGYDHDVIEGDYKRLDEDKP